MNWRYIIYHDEDSCYFCRLGLGIFWECGYKREVAREYRSRVAAASMLHKCGKQYEGWRILKEPSWKSTKAAEKAKMKATS